ncbi:hypothetical protein PQR46_23965 [Paraburkholderia sediminicola]|uniref:hypothetical protein n=1 Tax=Paraburkholderia TaxID=1822464 RepID=UPI0038BCA891
MAERQQQVDFGPARYRHLIYWGTESAAIELSASTLFLFAGFVVEVRLYAHAYLSLVDRDVVLGATVLAYDRLNTALGRKGHEMLFFAV